MPCGRNQAGRKRKFSFLVPVTLVDCLCPKAQQNRGLVEGLTFGIQRETNLLMLLRHGCSSALPLLLPCQSSLHVERTGLIRLTPKPWFMIWCRSACGAGWIPARLLSKVSLTSSCILLVHPRLCEGSKGPLPISPRCPGGSAAPWGFLCYHLPNSIISSLLTGISLPPQTAVYSHCLGRSSGAGTCFPGLLQVLKAFSLCCLQDRLYSAAAEHFALWQM